MWQGSGGILGVLAGLLTIALIVAGVLSMTDCDGEREHGHDVPRQALGFLGLGVAVFGLLKFLLVLTNSPGWAAFVGLVLLVAIGWGAWQKVQASGGFQMGGGAGGTGERWAAGHRPRARLRRARRHRARLRRSLPPSGGMPPSGSSDM